VLLDAQPPDPFTSLPEPDLLQQRAQPLRILPSVARPGVLRLAYWSAFGDLPAPARDQERADQASVRLQVSARHEMAQLRASLQQAIDLPVWMVFRLSS
jgi:hypothetical protein